MLPDVPLVEVDHLAQLGHCRVAPVPNQLKHLLATRAEVVRPARRRIGWPFVRRSEGLKVSPLDVPPTAPHPRPQRLAAEDPAKAEVVKLRFFAGMRIPEAAEVLGVSKATATRWWTYARAWLYAAVQKDDDEHRP